MIRAERGTAALLAAAVAAAIAPALLGACRDDPPDGVAFIGATVIDGRGGPPREDMVVVTLGNRIELVVPRKGFEIPDRKVKVEATGKWLIPGLIDAHVHTQPWMLNRYLAFGVTSLRDVHGTLDSILELREQATLNAVPSPRIYAAGSAIDGRPPLRADVIAAADQREARQGVDRLAVAGVDYISTDPRVTPALLRAIVDEAGTFGLRVAAHLGLTDAATAADLGVRAIEQLSGVPEAAAASAEPFYAAHARSAIAGWTFAEKSWASLDSAALARVAKLLVEKNVILVPTLVLHDTYSRLDDPAVLQDTAFASVPDSARAKWNLPEFLRGTGWTAADFEAFRRARPFQDLFLREFLGAGGVLAVGTDAPAPLIVPGHSLHTEMELLVRAGLTPADAILAATHDAAVLLGADSIGAIAPGMAADLVLLGRNPLDDIRNTRAVEQVMVRGHLMAADSIRQAW